jgi:hypothetical protein
MHQVSESCKLACHVHMHDTLSDSARRAALLPSCATLQAAAALLVSLPLHYPGFLADKVWCIEGWQQSAVLICKACDKFCAVYPVVLPCLCMCRCPEKSSIYPRPKAWPRQPATTCMCSAGYQATGTSPVTGVTGARCSSAAHAMWFVSGSCALLVVHYYGSFCWVLLAQLLGQALEA